MSVALYFFFFKQKTAYEMRISDWSSDVCSSDLLLSDRNQASIAGILDSTNRISRELANRAPEISATLAEARLAVRQSGADAEEIGQLAGTTNELLATDGKPRVKEMRQSEQQANKPMAAIDETMQGDKTGV